MPHPRTRFPRRSFVLRVAVAFALCCPGLTHAVTLKPGDIVLVSSAMEYFPPHSVYRLDPTTLAATLICTDGLIQHPSRVTVDHRGTILIADAGAGIVQVDPVSGAQTIVASLAQLGAGVPFGICAASDNSAFVTMRDGAASLLRVAPVTAAVSTVCSGGLLTNPGGVTWGPDGKLYVCEMSSPASATSQGSIVRIDPTSGSQTQVAACSDFYAPFDIAFVSADVVWTAQHGQVSRRMGGFISTRLSDGLCESAPLPPDAWSEGIVADGHGGTWASDCQTVSFSCELPYTLSVPSGAQIPMGGSLAIVPDMVTPTRQASWGALKTIYR